MNLISSRLSRFFIAILAGLTLSIIYGWFIHPVQPQNTSLENLRKDYKTDYVLMIAEAYNLDGNISKAVYSLEELGEKEPIRYVQEAIIIAQDLKYMQVDMERLAQLAVDLQSEPSVSQGGGDG